MTAAGVGIVAMGYALPATELTIGDEDYRRLDRRPNADGRVEVDLFVGEQRRRVLADGEAVETLMVDAARQAMLGAGLEAAGVDRLYGYASAARYQTPNSLYRIHRELGLPRRTLVVPINCEYSNFLVGVVNAVEAVRAGSAGHALVVTGSNWSRHLDYSRGYATAVSDAAGAAVIGPSEHLVLVDVATRTYSDHYETMTMSVRPRTADGWSGLPIGPDGLPMPTYDMHPENGVVFLRDIAWDGFPDLVKELLDRHGLTGADIDLITHQASRSLLDHWREAIGPAQHLETLAEFGNMTNASYPVNLAHHRDRITADHVVVVAMGTGCHMTAILLRS
ncbi:3-oxoacyl-[acyl-carrier-protein] synthase-3 [Allocatelliglobosispora scoriae]|uniref:3-oxoacyl-[acyl-carrier-protein] synthase-3 n=1 Tax=Allocatelliglobosispora scoriae TaxID=643052 RepID=A0A841BGS9_9ACTN|nr:3-oxoacyl-[acyl-carrier-protein] synthase III C-terminal domain-containing protein [Allocatelliglobosispora scoriae]MBB5866845.1 3-oxoacyl-[acyl-carrier-protein] synthase-3 [Allocatelliglobosispora scoriae]